MNYRTLQYLFSVFLVIACSTNLCSASPFEAEVSRIIDGDSIVVSKNKRKIEIRLYGIDSPEWQQHFSREARSCLSRVIHGKSVVVFPQYNDSYGRLVAHIERNGKNINGYLVEQGCAWVYPYFCRQKICDRWNKKQNQAKEEHKGLWREEQPVSPWIWKRMNHKKIEEVEE
ncbi:thermonuclease family protein [Desulfomarina sp.]